MSVRKSGDHVAPPAVPAIGDGEGSGKVRIAAPGQPVPAGAAGQTVAASAPEENVGAGAAIHLVPAGAALEAVVPRKAQDCIVASEAFQRIRAAVPGEVVAESFPVPSIPRRPLRDRFSSSAPRVCDALLVMSV